MTERRKSKLIHIGDVAVGGDSPIVVQSMTKTDTRNVRATVRQIKKLEEAGCEIIRVAVPDREAALALKPIIKAIRIPLIADIHFDYRLALEAIKAGVHGLRINPGNIGSPGKVAEVVKAAKERQIPMRIGANAGSLPKSSAGLPVEERLVEAVMEQVRLVESLDFDLIKLSLKAFDVPTTINAYTRIAARTIYPLHLGITEAGLPPAGIIRSTAGIAPLLWAGIGDTIRVSLTAPPVEEVDAAYQILQSFNLRQRGPIVVSCPTCGRTGIDTARIARQVDRRLKGSQACIKVAVMGCVVNGPGEARDADIGIAGGEGKAVLFKHGKVVRSIPEANILEELMAEIAALSGADCE